MKSFTNRATEITMPNEDNTGVLNMTYADLAVMCLNLQPEGKGFSLEEMEERLPIVAKLKPVKRDAGAIIELEDSQLRKLSRQVDEMSGKWAFMHEDIVGFNKYVKDLEKEVAPTEE